MTALQLLRAFWVTARGVGGGLPAPDRVDDPTALFGEWFEQARKTGMPLPEAMTLATVSADGQPTGRLVLLKGFGPAGFEFYTNYRSRKARELEENPKCALIFHWSLLQRQVRIEGAVVRLKSEESERYFRSRPRGSQIGAWASRQSEPLASRAELEARVAETERRFEGAVVPLPEFWGGYRVEPSRMEFWQGRLHRLHDRLRFDRGDGAWIAQRLYP